MPTIYLVRHGQNHDNAQGILNGHRDQPLTDLGREQAHTAGQKIVGLNLPITKIYTSPLARAYDTAQTVSDYLKLGNVKVHEDLIERDFGDLTGTPSKDITKNYHLDDIIITDHVVYFPQPKNGESFDECVQRGQRVLDWVNENHSGDEHILLVGHGDTSKSIYCAFYDLHWTEGICNFDMYNTDIVKLDKNIDPKLCKL